MEDTLENCISSLLSKLGEERLSEINSLLESGSWILPLNMLKEIKPNVQALATTAPDLFFHAAALYYAKVIQSIEITNLVDEYTLIPQYIKTIEIMKNLCIGEPPLLRVNFEPYIKTIVEGIKEILLSCESIEKTFAFLELLKEIETKFKLQILTQKEEYEHIDLGIQDYVEGEEDLEKSYSVIKEVKEGWNFDLFCSEGSWIGKARKRLEEENKETCDLDFLKKILIMLNSFKNEYYPEIEDDIANFCPKFGLDSGEIMSSEMPLLQKLSLPEKEVFRSSEFSPIFEDHRISDISQIDWVKSLRKHELMADVSVHQYKCLLNEMHICVKSFKGNSEKTINQYKKEVECYENLSKAGATIYLKYFGSFDYIDHHIIALELCKYDLSFLIERKVNFSDNDLAYFIYFFIESLCDLKKQRIYHRDIKPQNIVISYDNEFKLIDFNISDIFNDSSDYLTLSELQCKGTESHAAIEIRQGLKHSKSSKYSRERADVYSLGLVILEISNSELFQINRKDNVYIKDTIANSRPKNPWIKELLDKMLEENYKNRPRFEELLNFIKSKEQFMRSKEGYQKDWAKGN